MPTQLLTATNMLALNGHSHCETAGSAMGDGNGGCLTYTIAQAARLLGIGRNQAYEAARRGELPTIRIGARLLVPRERLHRMLGADVATESAVDRSGAPAK